jgi:hypothetical protein
MTKKFFIADALLALLALGPDYARRLITALAPASHCALEQSNPVRPVVDHRGGAGLRLFGGVIHATGLPVIALPRGQK